MELLREYYIFNDFDYINSKYINKNHSNIYLPLFYSVISSKSELIKFLEGLNLHIFDSKYDHKITELKFLCYKVNEYNYLILNKFDKYTINSFYNKLDNTKVNGFIYINELRKTREIYYYILYFINIIYNLSIII